MKHIKYTFFLALSFVLSSCGSVRYVPVIQKEVVTVRDTTVLHLRDTLVKVPEIRYKDFTGLLDTLSIRTSISEFRAYCDTTAGILRGDVTQSGRIPVQIVEKERIVYRDSVRDREVPVPVVEEKIVKVVPLFWRVFAFIGILATAVAVFWLLRRFKVL